MSGLESLRYLATFSLFCLLQAAGDMAELPYCKDFLKRSKGYSGNPLGVKEAKTAFENSFMIFHGIKKSSNELSNENEVNRLAKFTNELFLRSFFGMLCPRVQDFFNRILSPHLQVYRVFLSSLM